MFNTSSTQPYCPRSIRNRNLGNLRAGSRWYGLVGVDDDGFCIFNTYVDGVRACVKLLNTYRLRGYDTISSIIQHYAPSNENNTLNYIRAVVDKTGLDPDKKLWRTDYQSVILSIFEIESGYSLKSLETVCLHYSQVSSLNLSAVVDTYVDIFFPQDL